MTDTVRLRRARPSDHAALVAVMDAWWGRSIRGILPRLFLDHFWPTSWVAEGEDGSLAGFLVGFDSPAAPAEAYVHAVAVSPQQRTGGLGRRLYEAFLAEAAARGRTVVKAVTSPVNAPSIAFHRRLGFDVSDPVADYDGPGQDRVVFRMTVPPEE